MVEVGDTVTLFETLTDIYFLAKHFDNKYYIGAKLDLTNLYANVYDSNFNIISEDNWVKDTGNPNQYGISIITSIYKVAEFEIGELGSKINKLDKRLDKEEVVGVYSTPRETQASDYIASNVRTTA